MFTRGLLFHRVSTIKIQLFTKRVGLNLISISFNITTCWVGVKNNHSLTYYRATYNEIETKWNQRKRNETKRNQQKRMKIGLISFRPLLFFLPFSISFCFRWFRFAFVGFVLFRFHFVDFVSFLFVFVDFVSFRFRWFRFVSFLFRFALYRCPKQNTVY
jgi:hypothetical protein